MAWWILVLPIGLPALGALAVWVVAIRAWRAARPEIPPGPEGREARGRVIPLILLPTPLILFGWVIAFLVSGETLPGTLALPAALDCGVPGFLSGLGMALICRRGIETAAASREGFGRVMPLAVMPETSAVFGLVVSFLLIGGGSNPTGVPPFGAYAAWLASAFVMFGAFGGPLGAWLAVSSWDFKIEERWPLALARSGVGGYPTAACLAIALAVLAEWILVLLVVIYSAGIVALGLVRFARVRRKQSDAGGHP